LAPGSGSKVNIVSNKNADVHLHTGYSTDDAGTFNNVDRGSVDNVQLIDLDRANPLKLWFCDYHVRVWYSTNGGAGWLPSTIATPPGIASHLWLGAAMGGSFAYC